MNSSCLEYQHFFPFLFAVFRPYLLKTNFYITPPFHAKIHLTRKNPSVQLRILFVKTLPSLHCRELHFCQLRENKKELGLWLFGGGWSAVYWFWGRGCCGFYFHLVTSICGCSEEKLHLS